MDLPIEETAEILLQKIVGGIEPEGEIYNCKILSSDFSNPDEIRKLIAQVPRGEITNVAYYIRANKPSLEIYAFEKSEQITLLKDYSARELRDDSASTELISKIDAKCPTPKLIK
jgi:hypothetical protein